MGDVAERFELPATAILLLIREQKILLCRRYQTGWEDGKYGFMAGHIDGGESFSGALCREAMEELGIKIDPADVRFAHLQHHLSNKEYVYVYFAADKWEGEPEIKEPHKCDDIQWFPLDALPPDLVYNTADVIRYYRQGIYYSEDGFK
jgi:8-oxo-dGTP pyrophosphatase MutT (NUDIX family)